MWRGIYVRRVERSEDACAVSALRSALVYLEPSSHDCETTTNTYHRL
jgi:hypothetical protein